MHMSCEAQAYPSMVDSYLSTVCPISTLSINLSKSAWSKGFQRTCPHSIMQSLGRKQGGCDRTHVPLVQKLFDQAFIWHGHQTTRRASLPNKVCCHASGQLLSLKSRGVVQSGGPVIIFKKASATFNLGHPRPERVDSTMMKTPKRDDSATV